MTALAALALLSACATAAPSAPSTTATAAAPSAAPSRVAQMLGAAGRADAPTRADIERALGPADITRQDGAGTALTYRLETCGLLLLFSADSRNAMRLTEANPSARRGGGVAPSLEQCAAEASARRS